jgi:hypothetical protein
MRSFLEGTCRVMTLGTQGPEDDQKEEGKMEEKRGKEIRQVNGKIMVIQEDQDEDIWSTNYGLYTVMC